MLLAGLYQVCEQIALELHVELLCKWCMRSLEVTVAVQSPQSKEVDVEPHGPSPVGRIMLSVVRPMHAAALA